MQSRDVFCAMEYNNITTTKKLKFVERVSFFLVLPIYYFIINFILVTLIYVCKCLLLRVLEDEKKYVETVKGMFFCSAISSRH